MNIFSSTFSLVLLASLTRAQEVNVDSLLPPYRSVSDASGSIRGHSSAGMRDLMKVWGGGFRLFYPGVRIELDDVAFDDVGAEPATFGPWLGKLDERLRAKFKKQFGSEPVEIPVCLYVLAAYVHKDSPVRGGLRMMDVEAIFSYRFRNANWGDLNCEGKWQKRTINLYAPLSYCTKCVLEPHCGDRGFLFKKSVKRLRRDAAVVSSVANDSRGLGLASIGCRTRAVRVLALAPGNNSEFVRPTAENAANGSYPLVEKFHLVWNYDFQSGKELDTVRREFIRYIMSKDGQMAVVKLGFTPLPASQAKRALAEVGLVPSGEDSPWDRVLIGLRLRSAPADAMERVERLAKAVGSKTTLKELRGFNDALAATHLRSTIQFECDREAVIVRYRPVGAQAAKVKTAKKGSAHVRVGLYHIWTEREGKATSPRDKLFQIVREKEQVTLHEKR